MMFCKTQVKLLIRRMCAEWDNLPAGNRKAYAAKETVAMRQCCGMFRHFLGCLQVTLPSAALHLPGAKEKLMTQFLLGGPDADLTQAAPTSVPPGDLKSIGAIRRGWQVDEFFVSE